MPTLPCLPTLLTLPLTPSTFPSPPFPPHPLRLLMFHAAFLSMVGRPTGQPIGEVMYRLDSLYGRPGAGKNYVVCAAHVLHAGCW